MLLHYVMHQTGDKMGNKLYLDCGCISNRKGGYFSFCCKHAFENREKAWSEMSERQRDYDRKFGFDINAMSEDDLRKGIPDEDSDCCSCHIDPPCQFCVDAGTEDE